MTSELVVVATLLVVKMLDDDVCVGSTIEELLELVSNKLHKSSN